MAGLGPLLFAAVWLTSIPISTVILIVSMIASSSIAGGIEFGEIQVVIPKAMGLLLVVNVVSMIPVAGWFVTFPIWLFGLMILFRLDLWEARFLIAMNWILNSISKYIILGIVLAILFNVAGKELASDALGDGRNSANDKGQDGEAAKLLWEDATELRGWLDKDEKRVILGRSREQSVKIASELYNWGAKKVWAGDPVESTRSGIPRTKKVVVELPKKDAAARKKIIAYHNEVATQMNDYSIEDEGQKYVVIDYEAKERFGN